MTPQLLQMYLQYVRNLALLEHRLTPDLYTLVLAAKQLAGDDFAVTLLETAKGYIFQDNWTAFETSDTVAMGMGQLDFGGDEVAIGKNRLEGIPLEWRSLSLRPVPPKIKKRQWAFQWNPFGQCSWPSEDQRIEGFTSHVREQAKHALGADLAKVENSPPLFVMESICGKLFAIGRDRPSTAHPRFMSKISLPAEEVLKWWFFYLKFRRILKNLLGNRRGTLNMIKSPLCVFLPHLFWRI